MKIALFVKDYAIGKAFSKNGIPTKSGAEFHAERHAKALMALGHEVTIFAKKRYRFTKIRENIDGIDLVRLHSGFRWMEIILRFLTTHRDIDTVYVLGTPKFAVWGILMARFFHKPVTLALTGIAEKFDGKNSWRDRVFASCDWYLAMSQEIRRAFLRLGDIPEEKIIVQPQGIDTAAYPSAAAEEKQKLRSEHGLPPDAPVLLFCARVVLAKGIDTLERAWEILSKTFPAAHLVIVGGGDNALLDELRSMSERMDHRIHVIGEVAHTQPYYQMAEIYIFPSRHEGLPNTLMEAMATGLPSVVSDIGGCEDLIKDDVSGYRVDAERPDLFAERIMNLLVDEEKRKTFGARAAVFVRAHCDIHAIAKELEEVLARPARRG